MSKDHLYAEYESPNFSLRDLRSFISYLDAERKQPGLTVSDYARRNGHGAQAFGDHIRNIEADADTYFLHRAVLEPGSKKQRTVIDPESGKPRTFLAEFEEQVGDAEVRRQSSTTLDGQIWAEFAKLVLGYYELTRLATARMKAPEELGCGRSGTRRTARAVPTRHDKHDRDLFLAWLRYQREQLDEAARFANSDDRGVHDLAVRFVPGCEPEEKPDFHEEDTARNRR